MWCTLLKILNVAYNIALGHIILHGLTCPPITADGRRSCRRKPRLQGTRATHSTLQTLHQRSPHPQGAHHEPSPHPLPLRIQPDHEPPRTVRRRNRRRCCRRTERLWLLILQDRAQGKRNPVLRNQRAGPLKAQAGRYPEPEHLLPRPGLQPLLPERLQRLRLRNHGHYRRCRHLAQHLQG